MNPLLLTISHQVGFLLLQILTWAAAFTPWLILIICLIALLVLACVPGWMREAKMLDQALDFSPSSDEAEKNKPSKIRPFGRFGTTNGYQGRWRTNRRPYFNAQRKDSRS